MAMRPHGNRRTSQTPRDPYGPRGRISDVAERLRQAFATRREVNATPQRPRGPRRDFAFGCELEVLLDPRGAAALSLLAIPGSHQARDDHEFADLNEFADCLAKQYNRWLDSRSWEKTDRRMLSRVFDSTPQQNKTLMRLLKLVAQAVIYWEPAWEAIMPDERRGTGYARSNYVDNMMFALIRSHTREQAIDDIEQVQTVTEFLDLVHPDEAKYWGWNFWNVEQRCNTIEFRRGACSRSFRDVKMWIAAATCFILSAIQAGSIDGIRRRRCTVAELQQFMFDSSGFANGLRLSTEGVFARADIVPLFEGKLRWPTRAPLPDQSAQRNRELDQHLAQLTAGDVGRR
ncbi:MAG: hypothetical protein Q9162_004311 [Coniocarpon cinnabarinum]